MGLKNAKYKNCVKMFKKKHLRNFSKFKSYMPLCSRTSLSHKRIRYECSIYYKKQVKFHSKAK